MTDWQPIETAPRDGTVVLLFSPQYDMLFERFGAGEFEQCVTECCDGRWLHNLEGEPTHWMPLPAPPSS